MKEPAPRAGEALVRIEAAGASSIDVRERTGLYPVALPATLGQEGACVVDPTRPGVGRVRYFTFSAIALACRKRSR